MLMPFCRMSDCEIMFLRAMQLPIFIVKDHYFKPTSENKKYRKEVTRLYSFRIYNGDRSECLIIKAVDF